MFVGLLAAVETTVSVPLATNELLQARFGPNGGRLVAAKLPVRGAVNNLKAAWLVNAGPRFVTIREPPQAIVVATNWSLVGELVSLISMSRVPAKETELLTVKVPTPKPGLRVPPF